MSLADIFKADNFYALELDEARPELEKTLFTYLGIFPIASAERPQTDGKQIYLESRKADFKDPKEEMHNNRNMSLYVSDLVHELLHIREGSFLVDSRPYLESFQNGGLAHAVFNIIEDARIEHNAQAYLKPDDVELLQKSNEYLATKRSFPEKPQDRFMELFSSTMITKGLPSQFNPDVKSDEDQTLQAKLDNTDLNTQGINTISDLLQTTTNLSNSVYDNDVSSTWEVVPQVYELLTKAFPDIENEFPDSNSPYAPVQAPQSGGQGKQMQDPKKDKKEGDNQEGKNSGSGGNGNDKESQESNDGSGEGKTGKPQKAYTGFRGDVHDFSAGKNNGNKLENLVKGLPEKKQGRGKGEDYTSGGVGMGDDKLRPIDPDGELVQIVTYDDLKKAYLHIEKLQITTYDGSNPGFEAELEKYADIRRRVIEHFDMLQPNELQRIPFTEDPDEFNMEGLVEVMADPSLRANAKVYDSYIINERDSLTGILLDISGSTGGTLLSGKSVIDVEKISAGLIYQSLDEIGDQAQLYAFSTGNRITYLYKLSDIANLGALRPEGGNADGVAIRGVAYDMKRTPARDKTLIVISDGKPVGTGFGADPVVDTSMAFGEVEALGIRTVYFNVDNQPSSYFDKLVKNTTYAKSIRDVEQLPQTVSEFVMENI